MRAFVVHDLAGKIVSATIVPDGEDVHGDFMPAVDAHHRLTEVDISRSIESERKESKSENDAITRALSKLMRGL